MENERCSVYFGSCTRARACACAVISTRQSQTEIFNLGPVICKASVCESYKSTAAAANINGFLRSRAHAQ